MKPSKEQFLDYISIQESGITNMIAINEVCRHSTEGLTHEMCIYIMEHYADLRKEYLDD